MRFDVSRLVSHCPACKQAFQATNFVSLGEDQEGASWFHCDCRSCKHQMLAFVMEMGTFVSSIAMVADVSAGDAKRLLSLSPISPEECIAWHQALERDSGELCKMLQQR